MKKQIPILFLGALAFSSVANAILLERTPQGHYNHGVAPQVNYEELSIARKYPVAPQADDPVVGRVYTYNNNTSEYLRDELGLPRIKADERLNQYDVTYIPETQKLKNIRAAKVKMAAKARLAAEKAQNKYLNEH